MQTLLFANNRLGAQVAKYLHDREELAGLVLHPQDRRKAGPLFEDLPVPTSVWPVLPAAESVDCVLSVFFGYRIERAILDLPRWRAVNLHPSLLPFNRGAAPNVWPLLDGTPAGTTLHVMEEEIDTGAILAQQQVEVDFGDTAETLYRKLEVASLTMFCAHWPTIETLPERPQPQAGTRHLAREVNEIVLGPDELVVLDKVRARQFEQYSAEVTRGGRRFAVRVDITPL